MLGILTAMKDSLRGINPWLPIFVDVGTLSVVFLLVIIPVSFVSYLLHFATNDVFKQGIDHLSHWKLSTQRLALRCRARASRLVKQHRRDNRFSRVYPDPIYPDPPHPVYSTIEQIQKDIENAPFLAQNSEGRKADLIVTLNSHLEVLRNASTINHKIDIPRLDPNQSEEIKRDQARSELLIFVPLLMAVICVNTVLLNAFFDDLFGGETIIGGIPYSAVISLMFSLIEAGIGVVIAYFGQSKVPLSYFFSYIICGLATLGLMSVELVLYLVVGLRFFDKELGDIQELWTSGTFELFVSGGWLALLGPAIVVALYLFGHRAADSYFTYSKQSQLRQFRDKLNESYEQAQTIESSTKESDRMIRDITEQLRKEPVTLNNFAPELPQAVREYKDTIDRSLERIKQQVEKVESIPIELPEIQEIPISKAESENIFRSNIVYFVMLVASFFVLSSFLMTNLYYGINYFSAALLSALFIFIGNLYATKHLNIRAQNATFVAQQRTPVIVLVATAGIIASAWFLWNSLANTFEFSLAWIALFACFFCGIHLGNSIASWVVFCKSCLYLVASIFHVLCKLGCQLCVIIISILSAILEIFSYPARRILQR